MKLNSYSNTFPQKAKDQMSKWILSIIFRKKITNHEESLSKLRGERIISRSIDDPRITLIIKTLYKKKKTEKNNLHEYRGKKEICHNQVGLIWVWHFKINHWAKWMKKRKGYLLGAHLFYLSLYWKSLQMQCIRQYK